MEEETETSISKQLEALKDRETALTEQLEALERCFLGAMLLNKKSAEIYASAIKFVSLHVGLDKASDAAEAVKSDS